MEFIDDIYNQQKQYFDEGQLQSIPYRLTLLNRLLKNIKANEQALYQALYEDLNKSEFESYLTELSIIYQELNYMIKKVTSLSKTRTIKSAYTNLGSKIVASPHPYGQVLIFSPWNYPIQLALVPLIGAIAAGNVVILKLSDVSIASSQVITKIINETFTPNQVAIIMNNHDYLLSLRFNYIFFTGSSAIGKIVYQAAAQHLCPVTLELGGKNPAIVTPSANLKNTAQAIIFSKLLNAGQTCISSDYIIVHQDYKQLLIHHLIEAIEAMYTSDPLNNSEYPKIINERHFNRLLALIKDKPLIYGGTSNGDSLKIAPTLLDNITSSDSIMQEEIFGPLLPILTYHDIKQVKEIVMLHPNPLALYLFSNNQTDLDYINTNINFGGACFNDTIMQFNGSFGGVQDSGIGKYHKEESFKTFSYYKHIYIKNRFINLTLRYAPFKGKLNKLKRLYK
ncbi:MAG: aldehyde dehydrogenase family protein [Bacilli bacterium]